MGNSSSISDNAKAKVIKICEKSNLIVSSMKRDFSNLPVDEFTENIIVFAKKITSL